jgi:hypothetical protein
MQKSEVAQRDAQTITTVEEAGLISQQTALKELRQGSRVTGRFTNITDEDIEAADDTLQPPDAAELTGVDPETGEPVEPEDGEELPKPTAGKTGGKLEPKKTREPREPKALDAARDAKNPRAIAREFYAQGKSLEELQRYLEDQGYSMVEVARAGNSYREADLASTAGNYHGRRKSKDSVSAEQAAAFAGLPIVIETPRGSVRAGEGWSVVMPCDYGYVRGTRSAEGPTEELDCFVGPHADSRDVWIVDTLRPDTKEFDEHKLMLGFRSSREALDTFRAAYEDGSGVPPGSRVGGVTRMSLDEVRLREWIYGGDKTRALAQPPKLVAAR